MKNIKHSVSNRELVSQKRTTSQKRSVVSLTEVVAEYPMWLKRDIEGLLSCGSLRYLNQNDVECYDAEIIENENLLFVEVDLDVEGQLLENIHCTCNTGFCSHLAAVIWKIYEDKNRENK